MKPNKRSHPVLWLSVLLLGALACGGGGGGGESFIVTGLWSVAPTSSPGTPTPNDDLCNRIASTFGPLPGTTLNVVQQDGTVTASEVGSDLTFAGTVNSSNQSFNLVDTLPPSADCQTSGSCTVCATVNSDFLNAAGNTADVNVAFGATGSGSCPVTCTLVFQTTGTRS
jgi:hypothetical protein